MEKLRAKSSQNILKEKESEGFALSSLKIGCKEKVIRTCNLGIKIKS